MSRPYLQSHGVHETLQDCVHDLVLERPATTLEILATLQKRIQTNKTKNNCTYYVVLAGNAKAKEEIAKHLGDIASGRSAFVADYTALQSSANAAASSSYSYNAHTAKPLLPPRSSAFVINVNTIADAIKLQATSGPCKGCVVVADDEKDLSSREYLVGVNPVAQYYDVKAVGRMSIVKSVTEINGALA